MKAADILDLWDRVKVPLGYRSSAWIKLLRIAAAGDNGLTASQIVTGGDALHASMNHRWLRAAAKAGLLEVCTAPAHFLGGRAPKIYRLTPQGYKALGLEASA